jgi:hypothetical protein
MTGASKPNVLPAGAFAKRVADALNLGIGEPAMETDLSVAGKMDAVRTVELHTLLRDLGVDLDYETCAGLRTIRDAYAYYRAALRSVPVVRLGPQGIRVEKPGR